MVVRTWITRVVVAGICFGGVASVVEVLTSEHAVGWAKGKKIKRIINQERYAPKPLGEALPFQPGADVASPAFWKNAMGFNLAIEDDALQTEVRFDVVFDSSTQAPKAVRAWVLGQVDDKMKVDWQATRRDGAVALTVMASRGRGKKRVESTRAITVNADHLDPYSQHRHEDRYLSPLGVMWRCPPGALKLCRQVLMPMSYRDLPVDVTLDLLPGATSVEEAFAMMNARLAKDALFSQYKIEKNPKRSKYGWVTRLKPSKALGKKMSVPAWTIARPIGQHWVLCEVRPKVLEKPLKSKQAKAWFTRAKNICKRLEASPAFAKRPDCHATLDACVLSCGRGDGARCRDVAMYFASKRQDAQRKTYLEMGCRHRDGVSCRVLADHTAAQRPQRDLATALYTKACQFGDVTGCVSLLGVDGLKDVVRQDALTRGCAMRHASSCMMLSTWKAKRGVDAQEVSRLSRRACVLGHLPACE